MYVVKVFVQLPDGSFAWCPVAKENGEVVQKETFKDACNWAECALSDLVNIVQWAIKR